MDFFFTHQQHDDNGLALARYRQENATCCSLVEIDKLPTMDDPGRQHRLSWLSCAEKEHLQQFRFPKRYREWLGGRIAAKCCLLHGAQPQPSSPEEFSILPDSYGRPTVTSTASGESIEQCVSISHSQRYAVAICSPSTCGIDIQQITPRILRVQQRCTNQKEVALVTQTVQKDKATILTLIWAVKEAVKKHKLSTEPGIFEAIQLRSIHPGQHPESWHVVCQLVHSGSSWVVHALQREDYILAWSQG